MVRVRRSKEKAECSPDKQEKDNIKPPLAQGLDYNIGNWFLELSKAQEIRGWKVLAIIFGFAIFIRLATGLGPYSGFNDPPVFGDYEAQRHWLEITHHLPLTQWYFHDLHYWGLDYPPLTAFHSKLLGFIAHAVDPAQVELYASRGLESTDSKIFMRLTVLASDILVFFSGAVYFAWPSKKGNAIPKIAGLALLLANPSFTLIDHGHFQYNCVMLGFALWAFGLLSSGHRLLGAFAFCMALGFKQMALFYALPVFFYLLGHIFFSGFLGGTILLIKVGITTVFSLGGLVAPFLYAGHHELKDFGKTQVIQIFHRLFPVGRGLYEDKVANFWCAINVAVKLRSLYSVAFLARVR
ncbi:Glucosyltransferase-like protein [Entomophthora muscae]|uniref:Glucosyltransferase-like protein n=1 Tax=Entomophthora muscae TaxID=34485 RepID=A0ACC2RT50_9FUNG|nr:Glucosyltransferase-like protein [Entomophthora muscae]